MKKLEELDFLKDMKKNLKALKTLSNKELFILIGVFFAVTGAGIYYLVPSFGEIYSGYSKIQETKNKIDAYNAEKSKSEEDMNQDISIPKTSIYKPPYRGLNVKSASGELVWDLVNTVKETNNKVLSIAYTDENTNDLVKDLPKGYSILKLDLKLENDYLSLQNLLNKVFAGKYLIEIYNLTISSPDSGSGVLNTDICFLLYIEDNN
jgi:hypothetical protein